jgi:hypothetical protein
MHVRQTDRGHNGFPDPEPLPPFLRAASSPSPPARSRSRRWRSGSGSPGMRCSPISRCAGCATRTGATRCFAARAWSRSRCPTTHRAATRAFCGLLRGPIRSPLSPRRPEGRAAPYAVVELWPNTVRSYWGYAVLRTEMSIVDRRDRNRVLGTSSLYRRVARESAPLAELREGALAGARILHARRPHRVRGSASSGRRPSLPEAGGLGRASSGVPPTTVGDVS